MTSPFPTYREVQQLNLAGRFAEALAVLDTLPATGIHLWQRGWALHHLGRAPEAHVAMEQAEPLLTGSNLGRMLTDRAVLYGHDRQFARSYDLFIRGLRALQDDPTMIPIATYNLGWQHLTRLQFSAAQTRLEAAAMLAERTPGTGGERLMPRVGMSTLNRIIGNPEAALQRARRALEVADGHRYASAAYRAQAQALKQLGKLDAARNSQARALEVALPGTHQASERLLLALADRALGIAQALEPLKEGALPLDALRADLHLADVAFQAGQDDDALNRLRKVLGCDEPFPVWDEEPMLAELYAFGRQHGLPLPVRAGHPDREVTIRTLGRPELQVNGQDVAAPSLPALALMAYLAVYGQTRVDVLVEELLGSEADAGARQRIRRLVTSACRSLSDPRAITLQDGIVTPSPLWRWQTDVAQVLGNGTSSAPAARGAFLPGFYIPWSDRVQRQLDDMGWQVP
ncbi:hypothetical protein [Deinococcus gobiensis]|uniref:Uncharacterized protein n=1 Tax=Deinococcus gobiensis (strain DSM 21396 / JCM 16679 / CGMCC 1.7299 / I-0) TaxID=745776 RepID=H8H3M3_DEIGI|nr:hypothetical protein [Deinococcus gobiensis]AFD28120.1 hypothetical protein DGo_PD0046 [Deinococcus gobiensis I-0]